MHAFAIARMAGGLPDIDFEATPVHGYTLGGTIANFGAYLFGGMITRLIAINALPQVIGICALTRTGDIHWPELNDVIAPAVRTKLNMWLAAHEHPTIPVGWTYRQVLKAVYARMNDKFDLDTIYVDDGQEVIMAPAAPMTSIVSPAKRGRRKGMQK